MALEDGDGFLAKGRRRAVDRRHDVARLEQTARRHLPIGDGGNEGTAAAFRDRIAECAQRQDDGVLLRLVHVHGRGLVVLLLAGVAEQVLAGDDDHVVVEVVANQVEGPHDRRERHRHQQETALGWVRVLLRDLDELVDAVGVAGSERHIGQLDLAHEEAQRGQDR